jgi:hypothetical protein
MADLKCLDCDNAAYVHFQWGPSNQQANFCKSHAAKWWKDWGSTPAGERLTITDLQAKENDK